MEHRIQVNNAIRELFLEHRIFVQDNLKFDRFTGSLHFADNLQIEPHVELIGTNGELWSMGTSSYTNFGQFPVNTKIGRFTSISQNIKTFRTGISDSERFSISPITFADKGTNRGNATHDVYGFIPLSAGFEMNKGFEPSPLFYEEEPIVIGNDVWIDQDVWIRSGVHIGDGAIIDLDSIVTKDIPPYTVCAGSPAVPLRQRFADKIIERLEDLRWWEYPYWEFEGVNGDMPIETFIDRIENLLHDGKLLPYIPAALTAPMLLNAAD